MYPWNKGIKTGIKPWLGKKRSQETIEKIRETKLSNPVRFWLGRNRSDETKTKMSLAKIGKHMSPATEFKKGENLGEKHWNWKGNYSQQAIKRRMRNSVEWKNWRNVIFNRDGFKCFDCGEGGYLEPHHIIPLKQSLSRAFDVNNGITLCRPCHKLTMGKELNLMRNYFSLVQVQDVTLRQ